MDYTLNLVNNLLKEFDQCVLGSNLTNMTTPTKIHNIFGQSDLQNKKVPSQGIRISDECVYDLKYNKSVVSDSPCLDLLLD